MNRVPQAVEILKRELKDCERESQVYLLDCGLAEGINPSTMHRARKKLPIVLERHFSEETRRWKVYWSLVNNATLPEVTKRTLATSKGGAVR